MTKIGQKARVGLTEDPVEGALRPLILRVEADPCLGLTVLSHKIFCQNQNYDNFSFLVSDRNLFRV